MTAVMTNNGSCHRSGAFAKDLGAGVKRRFTRPYRPQTNGKVERFNRTIAQEWAYAVTYESDEARAATYDSDLTHGSAPSVSVDSNEMTPVREMQSL